MQCLHKIQHLFLFYFTLADGFNLSPVCHSTSIGWLREVTVKKVNHNRIVVRIKNTALQLHWLFTERCVHSIITAMDTVLPISDTPILGLLGPFHGAIVVPLCHALSLSSSLSVVVVDIDAQATPGEWACGSSQ